MIPVSRSTLQELLVQAPWARRRFHLVENGVDPDVFPAGTQDEGFGLFVGRLERVKAPDLVVEAFRRLGLPLKVVGAGPLAASLRAAAPPNVSFEGPFTDAGLARLYRGASVCAFPSQSEGYPFVVLEALSSGAPVISTRSFLADPPARDLVRWLPHGVFASTPARRQTREAILADLVAAIKELWGTKTPQNARHRHAVVRANHSWAKATKSIIDVYEGVLQEESRR